MKDAKTPRANELSVFSCEDTDMEIFEMSPGDLTPYEFNPRKNDKSVDKVAASIKEFGFRVPIVVDADNVIVCGHTRLKAALKLGLDTVPVTRADDLTEEQIKAFRLADNKVGESSEWDNDLLGDELGEIFDLDMSTFGFSLDEPTPTERKDLSSLIEPEYQIIIDCKDEMEQEDLYNRLEEEGIKCRVLTL